MEDRFNHILCIFKPLQDINKSAYAQDTVGVVSPGVSLEDLALKVGVDESAIDGVDDEAESKGDEVLCESVVQVVLTSG